jgi:hypothetical protein
MPDDTPVDDGTDGPLTLEGLADRVSRLEALLSAALDRQKGIPHVLERLVMMSAESAKTHAETTSNTISMVSKLAAAVDRLSAEADRRGQPD